MNLSAWWQRLKGMTVREWAFAGLIAAACVAITVVCMVIFLPPQSPTERTHGDNATLRPWEAPKPTTSKFNVDRSIFVSVPSYRDPETRQTLLSLFHQADHPENIRVGLLQQRYASDPDEVVEYRKLARTNNVPCYSANIRSEVWSADKAAGPTVARAHIEATMLRNERYVLMVDSHTQFVRGWDSYLMKEWARTKDPNVVLSTYARDYSVHHRHELVVDGAPPPSMVMVIKDFPKDNPLPRHDSHPPTDTQTRANKVGAYRPAQGWAAGFSFAAANVHREVPYVALRNCFFGEEVFMHARFFTHGCTVVHPNATPVYTAFDRRYRHTVFTDRSRHKWKEVEGKTLQHMAHILGCDGGSGVIGADALGSVRPIQDFWDMLGIDIVHRTFLNVGQGMPSRQNNGDHVNLLDEDDFGDTSTTHFDPFAGMRTLDE